MANKVCIVDRPYRADYKVFFVERDGQEKNAQIIKGCKLVERDYQADCKVFIVDREYQADIKITRKNFPKR